MMLKEVIVSSAAFDLDCEIGALKQAIASDIVHADWIRGLYLGNSSSTPNTDYCLAPYTGDGSVKASAHPICTSTYR